MTKNRPLGQNTIWYFDPGVNFSGGQNTIWHRYCIMSKAMTDPKIWMLTCSPIYLKKTLHCITESSKWMLSYLYFYYWLLLAEFILINFPISSDIFCYKLMFFIYLCSGAPIIRNIRLTNQSDIIVRFWWSILKPCGRFWYLLLKNI
jgi:hypothetical protein